MSSDIRTQSPIFEFGLLAIKTRGVCIFGLSVGNSYFKEEAITRTLSKICNLFSKIYILIGREITLYNFQAINFDESVAKMIIRKNCNGLANIVKRVLEKIQILEGTEIIFVDWENDVANCEDFKKYCSEIKKLYSKNERFYNDVNSLTMNSLKKLAALHNMDSNLIRVEIGASYLLEELAFFNAYSDKEAPKIVADIYHHHNEVLENFMNGIYDGIVKNFGFVVLE